MMGKVKLLYWVQAVGWLSIEGLANSQLEMHPIMDALTGMGKIKKWKVATQTK